MFCTACREELAYLAKTADVSPDLIALNGGRETVETFPTGPVLP